MKIGRRKDEGSGFSVYQESWIAGSPKERIAWNNFPVVTYAYALRAFNFIFEYRK